MSKSFNKSPPGNRTVIFLLGSVVPGAGAFEVAVSAALTEFKKTVKGRARLGVQVWHAYEKKVFPIQTSIVQISLGP